MWKVTKMLSQIYMSNIHSQSRINHITLPQPPHTYNETYPEETITQKQICMFKYH